MQKIVSIFLGISLIGCHAASTSENRTTNSTHDSQLGVDESQEESTSPLDRFNALQAVTVTSKDWSSTSGVLRTFTRKTLNEPWQKTTFEIPVSLGRNGMGWGLGLHPRQYPLKVEGDGQTPAGIFSLGIAFGYQQSFPTKLNYVAMTREHWCIDDPELPTYNQIVTTDQSPIGTSTERMLRADILYKLGVFVNHNPEAIKNAGSCIFVHIWRNPGSTTAGCTAMTEDNIKALLSWLDAAKNPVFIALPANEYQAKKEDWKLPRIW